MCRGSEERTFLDDSGSELDDIRCRPKVVGERKLLGISMMQHLVEQSNVIVSWPSRRVEEETVRRNEKEEREIEVEATHSHSGTSRLLDQDLRRR